MTPRILCTTPNKPGLFYKTPGGNIGSSAHSPFQRFESGKKNTSAVNLKQLHPVQQSRIENKIARCQHSICTYCYHNAITHLVMFHNIFSLIHPHPPHFGSIQPFFTLQLVNILLNFPAKVHWNRPQVIKTVSCSWR